MMRAPAAIVCLAAMLALAARADEPALPTGAADPPPAMTEFQWAIYSGGALVLVPVEGHIYPARRTGEAVIETLPVQIPVALHSDGRELAVPVRALRSPFEMLDDAWIMEIKTEDGGWRPIGPIHFHASSFYVQTEPGRFDAVGSDEIRFRAR